VESCVVQNGEPKRREQQVSKAPASRALPLYRYEIMAREINLGSNLSYQLPNSEPLRVDWLDLNGVPDVQVHRRGEVPREREGDGSANLPEFAGQGHCAASVHTSEVL